MPTLFELGGAPFDSSTGARKFSSPDSVPDYVDNVGSAVVDNQDLLFGQIDANRSISSTVGMVADASRESLDAIRQDIDFNGVPVQGVQTTSVVPSNHDAVFAGLGDPSLSFYNPIDKEQLKVLVDTQKNVFDSVFQSPSFDSTANLWNPYVPELETISLELDKTRGVLDCFVAKIVFSVPFESINTRTLKVFRFFRAEAVPPRFQRGSPPVLSMTGIERIASLKSRSRSKNSDITSIVHGLDSSGVPNAVSSLNPIDPETNVRLSSEESEETFVSENSSRPANNFSEASFQSSYLPSDFGFLDPSVAKDMKVLQNIRRNDPRAAPPQMKFLQVVNSSDQPGGEIVLNKNNSQSFREIGFFSADKIKFRQVAGRYEFTVYDETIQFGRGYRYFLNSVDKDMVESIRSRIVEVTVEGVRVPERPKRVFFFADTRFVSFNTLVDDELVEKFEIYRRNVGFASDFAPSSVVRVSDSSGFNVSSTSPVLLSNDFTLIGEFKNSIRGGGGTFMDSSVVPGKKYEYRVYSVDVFGNKSESPYELLVFIPDRSVNPNDLIKPTISGEVDSQTGKARVTFSCKDNRVVRLLLSRRDLTIRQSAFTVPSQVNLLKLGSPKAGEGAARFRGELLTGENVDLAWNGLFPSSFESTVFVDRTVLLDHVYQYRIVGVDRYGNQTSGEICRPFMITRRPVIGAPVNLAADVVQGPDFQVGGIQVSWQNGNVDISGEDMLGNRESLSNSSVRTVYQVERKKNGEERWVQFPLTEESSLFDPSSVAFGEQTQNFRPGLVETGETYVYRIKAVQTGSYVSNYTENVEVFASLPIEAPSNIRLRASDTKVKPFYIAINWDTPVGSGVVDLWEIERAEVNNFAASHLNSRNPKEFSKLSWAQFRKVFRESSRFKSQTTDSSSPSSDQTTIFDGQHYFQDMQVDFGNSYFYRIRSVSKNGDRSAWSYKGMKITDSTFERKLASAITQERVDTLKNSFEPLFMNDPDITNSGKSSFDLRAGFTDRNEFQLGQFGEE